MGLLQNPIPTHSGNDARGQARSSSRAYVWDYAREM